MTLGNIDRRYFTSVFVSLGVFLFGMELKMLLMQVMTKVLCLGLSRTTIQ